MIKSEQEFINIIQPLVNDKHIPLNGTFEITSRCNLNCVMCYTRKAPDNKNVKDEELSKDEIIALAAEARNSGMLYVLLTGGEIFLRSDFKEIYEAFTELGLIITLFTNGTLINKEVADWLSKRPPHLISITLYGASAETYQRITGVANGFEKAINAVDLLLERKLNVELKTTWLKGNIDDFPKLKELANSKGLNLGVVNYVFPSIDSENSDPVGQRLDPIRLAEESKIFENKYMPQNEPNNAAEYNGIVNNTAFECAAGKRFFTISWDGKMRACTLINNIALDVKPGTFLKSFEELNDSYKKIASYEGCDECVLKDYCFTCPARRLVETGSYYKKSAYLCEYAEAMSLQNKLPK